MSSNHTRAPWEAKREGIHAYVVGGTSMHDTVIDIGSVSVRDSLHLVRCVNAAPELAGMVLHLIACQRSGNTLVLVQAVAEVARAFDALDLEGVANTR